jgi:hypothetical protein
MTGKAQKPPTVEPFVMLPRELLRSDAWRSQGINTRRVIDFLMHEHLSHGGAENGMLKAPYRQLEAFGVGARYLADAIREAEELGLVDCCRGGLRKATTYALTWLPLHDGSSGTNRWRNYRNTDLAPLSAPKGKTLPAKGDAGLAAKGKADGIKLLAKGKADSPKTQPAKGKALSRDSYHGGTIGSVLEQKGAVKSGSGWEPGEEARRFSSGKPYVSVASAGAKKRWVL